MKYIFAIDADTEKSGYAILDSQERRLIEVGKMEFFPLLSRMHLYRENTLFVVERNWDTTKNFHYAQNVAVASRIANNTGRNQQTAILLAEYCKSRRLTYYLQKPLCRVWQKGKISAEELKRTFDGYDIPTRTNQDERDAILLAINAERANRELFTNQEKTRV